jgi:hypothetical protein
MRPYSSNGMGAAVCVSCRRAARSRRGTPAAGRPGGGRTRGAGRGCCRHRGIMERLTKTSAGRRWAAAHHAACRCDPPWPAPVRSSVPAVAAVGTRVRGGGALAGLRISVGRVGAGRPTAAGHHTGSQSLATAGWARGRHRARVGVGRHPVTRMEHAGMDGGDKRRMVGRRRLDEPEPGGQHESSVGICSVRLGRCVRHGRAPRRRPGSPATSARQNLTRLSLSALPFFTTPGVTTASLTRTCTGCWPSIAQRGAERDIRAVQELLGRSSRVARTEIYTQARRWPPW